MVTVASLSAVHDPCSTAPTGHLLSASDRPHMPAQPAPTDAALDQSAEWILACIASASDDLILLPNAEMTGTLTAFPAILYSRPSEKPRAATLLNCSSVKPCSRQHSLGVSLRMTPWWTSPSASVTMRRWPYHSNGEDDITCTVLPNG